MDFKIVLLCIIGSYLVSSGDGANILGIFHIPSPSHHTLGSTLLKALAKRGHQVTMISPYLLKEPVENYTDISVAELGQMKEEYMSQMLKSLNETSLLSTGFEILKALSQFTELVYEHPRVQNLLQSDAEFDLIILVWTYSEALLGIAHHYKAPVIAFSTKGSTASTNYVTNNPNPYSYVPCLLFPHSDKMGFVERAVNMVGGIFSEALALYIAYHTQKDIVERQVPDAPEMDQLLNYVSLVMLNSHHSIETPRPYVPNMVQVGGLHVEEPKNLTQDLQEFLDNATEGVIYFSLGSNLKSADMPDQNKRQITRALGSVPQKVLLKWEDEDLPEKPANVKLGKWLPQNDILAHPNVKAFVTHGGLLSTTEAVYHGVPIIGIPFYSDQKTNVGVSVSAGYAIGIAFEELTEKTLSDALREIVQNPKYKENVKQRSRVMRDQPLKPLDNAVFWVEYVLRHKGASHLKTQGANLSWYQLMLLDVVGLLLGILLLAMVALYIITKCTLRIIVMIKDLLIGSKSKKSMKQKLN